MVALQNVGCFLRLIKDKGTFLITYPTKRRNSVGSIFDEVRSVHYEMEHRFSCLIRGLYKSDLGGAIARFQLMLRQPSFVDKNKAANFALFSSKFCEKSIWFCHPTKPFYFYNSLEDGCFLSLQ